MVDTASELGANDEDPTVYAPGASASSTPTLTSSHVMSHNKNARAGGRPTSRRGGGRRRGSGAGSPAGGGSGSGGGGGGVGASRGRIGSPRQSRSGLNDPTAASIAHALEKLSPGGAQVLSAREGAVAAKYIAELQVAISKLHEMKAKG